jgi:hypothetical protein
MMVMKRKFALAIDLVAILACALVQTTLSAEISLGVKAGDWIEYTVTYEGTPPEKHQTWVKVEILSVEGTNITLGGTVEYSDGTQETPTTTVDLEAGKLGDGFVIPANLTSGDTFYDKNEGNITIKGVEEGPYAGARRTVVQATISQGTLDSQGTLYAHWDKSTGVLVEAKVFTSELTTHVKADRTNLWQAQLFGLEPIVFSALIIAVVAIVAIVSFLVIRRRKSSPLSA